MSTFITSVADLEGTEPATPLPCGRQTTPSRYSWSFCCKTHTSEYSKWLSPVAFWQL